jgi:hypothetical protein
MRLVKPKLTKKIPQLIAIWEEHLRKGKTSHEFVKDVGRLDINLRPVLNHSSVEDVKNRDM